METFTTTFYCEIKNGEGKVIEKIPFLDMQYQLTRITDKITEAQEELAKILYQINQAVLSAKLEGKRGK